MVEPKVPVTAIALPMTARSPIRARVRDARPRLLRRVLPTAWATAEPLTGSQVARMKAMAYH